MFGIFASQNSKMRATARNWIETAERVWNYRRDLLSDSERRELRAATETLRDKVARKVDAADLKLGIESLEPVLARLGGKIYPKTALIDNVEFFLVAAIVLLGIRAFIAQPFKIPTNSMWPSYYGMTADNLMVRGEDPGLLSKAFRFVAFGAFAYEPKSSQDGDITLRIGGGRQLAYSVVKGRKWLVLPTQYKEYTFLVGSEEVRLRMPLEFNDREFEQVVFGTLFGSQENYDRALNTAIQARKITTGTFQPQENVLDERPCYYFNTGKVAKSGKAFLRFDVLTGDQLFVDRISYHFVRPSVGDGFVFRTGNISRLAQDQFYIKRLVGLPGDKLEVKEPALYRNGAPIQGSEAFGFNARREGLYSGYVDSTTLSRGGNAETWPYLTRGSVLTVPPGGYFAMGDNSNNSLDGRNWGFVPEMDIVGRPLFIYFPFTKRWGLPR